MAEWFAYPFSTAFACQPVAVAPKAFDLVAGSENATELQCVRCNESSVYIPEADLAIETVLRRIAVAIVGVVAVRSGRSADVPVAVDAHPWESLYQLALIIEMKLIRNSQVDCKVS